MGWSRRTACLSVFFGRGSKPGSDNLGLLQTDPKPKCSLSSATCCFCGGAAGYQGTWECYFSGAACTLLPASWFSLPPLAALSTLVHFKSLIWLLWYFHSLRQIRELGKEESEAREVTYVGRKLNSHGRDTGHTSSENFSQIPAALIKVHDPLSWGRHTIV